LPAKAPDNSLHNPAKTPIIRRHKTDTPPPTPKRHKTVRPFLTKYPEIFFHAGIKTSHHNFALWTRDETAVCYQSESIDRRSNIKKILQRVHGGSGTYPLKRRSYHP
ncbi:hypothetical protein, partial [Pseudomonas brassicae]|uniref:hypothetical protein n=1 Tax=Pseudomonas brassicae TaxID=2708063 RepID=UPI001FB43FE1